MYVLYHKVIALVIVLASLVTSLTQDTSVLVSGVFGRDSWMFQ